MIEMLDVPSADRLGGLKVFRLKYASAKNLAEILQGLVTGQSVSSSNNSNNSSNSSNPINNLFQITKFWFKHQVQIPQFPLLN
jgi:general secretion pathway protein D